MADKDERFQRFATDAKFRGAPKKSRKLHIDKRFESMFTDKRFVTKASVDKRGRPRDFSTQEDYRRYYSISDEDDTDEEEESATAKKSGSKAKESKKRESVGARPDSKADPNIRTKLKDLSVDYARGEGVLASDSSSEEDSEPEEELDGDAREEETFDKWGELDHEAEHTEEVTKRLAVCNMDWDRVGAEDIFLALASFCPSSHGGNRAVQSVKIYPSEFGKERLKEEEKLGPRELRDGDEGESDEESDKKLSEAERERKAMERVRKYQVNRLKYYYAVVEFANAEAANKVYEECDGTEYELSATRFDLRFIPDDMTFEDEPTSVCESMPDPTQYKPKLFCTTALQLGKVELTWDETDPDRRAAMERAFAADSDDDNNDYRAYLAASSDEEGMAPGVEGEDEEDTVDTIAKYRALLAEIKDKEEAEKDEAGAMEVVFADNDQVTKEIDAKNVEKLTPWERYLHKRKQKKKSKREAKQMGHGSQDAEAESQESGLQLLVMDSDEDKRHFDYKEIVSKESRKDKKKKKRSSKQVENETVSDEQFQIDLKDDRFSAIFDHADFNVDPSHPNFKKTKSMQEVIKEKQRRILDSDAEPSAKKSRSLKGNPSELDSLVRKVQSKKHKVGKVKKY